MASTSLIDLMSSPDPLTDGVPSSVVARRVTRSQTSQRFYSFKESPRKQTFELDVGNDISPQRIRVTVEADDHTGSGVKRRLFQSPTPKRNVRRKSMKATTTTVPLRGLTDDETGVFSAAGTPRRGRPRRSGTPRKPATPATLRRGRPATPGGRFERSKSVSSRDVLQSDTDAASHRTPRPGSTVKRVAKRKTITPMMGDDIQSSLPRKRRGRPRKESTLPSEITALSEQESVADGEVEDNASVAQTEDNASVAGNRFAGGSGAGTDFDDDIWLATLSDQATPVARRWHGDNGRGRVSESVEQDLPLRAPEPQPAPSEHSDADYSQPEEYMEFGGMEPHSDVESEPSEHGPAQDNTAQDTVMSHEEFTMISIGSLPSMQPNSSMMAPQPQEFGEATSLIINRTLEELRQSQNRSAQQASNTNEAPHETIEPAEMSFIQQQQEQQQQAPISETSLFAQPNPPQSWITRSPRRNKGTPLVKQVAKNLLQADNIDSPARPLTFDNQEAPDTSAYDDSFSQIPEAVLEAATPRRPRQPPPPSEDEEEEEENAPTHIQPSIERPSTVNHSNPQSESNRLLTPDETPSIPSDDEGTKSQPSASKPAPVRESEMRSSPPDVHVSPNVDRSRNESFKRHSRTRSTETPTERPATFRSPALAALNAQHLNLAPPEPQRRPTLSPIVRAGRALQFITSDPPSPPNRDSVLRSPFRGSVAKSSPPLEQPTARTTQSPPQAQRETSARPAGRSWLSPFTHIKDLVVQGAQALSPQPPAAPVGMEDPFGPLPNEPARPPSSRSLFSFGNRQPQTKSGEAGAKSPSPQRTGSFHDNGGNNEMSWQAESPSRRSRPSSRDRPGSAGSSIHAARGSSPGNRGHAMMRGGYEQQIMAEPRDEEEEEEVVEVDEIEDSQPDLDQYQGQGMEAEAESEPEPGPEPEEEPLPADQYEEDEEQPEIERPREGQDEEQKEELGLEDDADIEMEYEYEDEMELDQEQDPEPEPEPELEPEPEPEPEARSNRGQAQVEYQEEEEEEEDIWAIEAQRPTPYTNKQSAPAREPSGFPPRRSKLPSPWRKNSKRLVYSDELRQLSDDNVTNPRSEADEFSLLSQNNQPKPPPLTQPTPHAAQAKKPDLSAFFSSPADLPDPTLPGYGLFKSRDGKNSTKKSAPQAAPLRQQIRSNFQPPKPQSFGNSLFPQVAREEPPPRQSFGNSLFPPLPREEEPENRRTQKLPSIPQKEFHVDRANREFSILQSPVRDRSVEATISEPHQSSSPTTPERSAFSVVPQKMNFTPRSRNAQNTLFNPTPKAAVQEAPASSNSLFSSARRQISAFFTSTAPAPATRDDEDEEMQDYDEEEEEDESMAMSPDLSFERQKRPPQPPRFNPVPNRAMSPTKSSFRSPMKPKTPGRVVEFTSSTLSPLAQAQARAERRASASPEKEAAAPPSQPQPMRFSSSSPSSTSGNSNGNRSPTRGPPQASSSSLNARENEHDKENQWGEEEMEQQEEQEPVSYFNSGNSLFGRPTKPGPLSSNFLPPKPSGITAHHLPTPKPSSSTTSNSSVASNNENTTNANFNRPLPKTTTSTSTSTNAAVANPPKQPQQPQQKQQDVQKKQPKQPLSQSQWTRDHWLRLDELLQARRKGTLQFQLTVRQVPAGNSIPANGGKHHRLLGKQVTTAGPSGGEQEEESMILEAWHLDIVEAFRREVLLEGHGAGAGNGGGGVSVNVKNNMLWTDEVLAKRLFALMVGEERRAAGRVDRAARRRRERERELERERERERERRQREREREDQTEEIRWY